MADNVVFLGNSGVGKSYLLNSVLGRIAFISSPPDYNRLQKEESYGVTYVEAPGLDDEHKREKAAVAISAALRLGGSVRLFFIIKLEAGHVRHADSCLLCAVLKSIDMDSLPFSIIVNQLSQSEHATLQHAPKAQDLLNDLFSGLTEKQKSGHRATVFITQVATPGEKGSALLLTGQQLDELRSSVKQAALIRLGEAQVKDLDVSRWEQEMQHGENRLKGQPIVAQGPYYPGAYPVYNPQYPPAAGYHHPIHINPVPGIPHMAGPAGPAAMDTRCWNIDWLLFILGIFFTIPFFVGSIMGCVRRKNPVTGKRHRNSSQQAAWICNTVFSVLSILWLVYWGIQVSTSLQQFRYEYKY